MKSPHTFVHITWKRSHFVALIAASFSLSQLNAAISLLNDVKYTQNFNELPNIGARHRQTKLPAYWGFVELGPYGDDFFNVNGNYDTYGVDSYSSQNDEALGAISGIYTVIPIIGTSFLNNVGSGTIDLSIIYTGEQWTLGSGIQHVDFQYSTNATSLTTGTWKDFDSLDLISSVSSGGVGILDGNLARNQKVFSASITSLNVPDNSIFWIRWNYESMTSSPALAIDDFSIVAVPEFSSTLLAACGVLSLLWLRRRHLIY